MTNQMASARQIAELDIDKVRADFPILSRQVNGKPLVYLDSAASAQKPNQVIEALVSAYQDTYSNVHRGLHFCLLYTSPSPRDRQKSRMPSSA